MYKILKLFLLVLIISFSIHFNGLANDEKIKIGLLVPMTGENKALGQELIKSTRLALNDINSDKIEIYPKDTGSDPSETLRSAIALKNIGIKIIIGPIFFKNLIYLNEIEDVIFLSLTNKTIDLPKNVISSGINSTSQLNTIKKFLKLNKIENVKAE